jgi:hypothetical protein
LERALGQFELGRGRLVDQERAAFAHGWLAGDDGLPLADVLNELEPRHRDYPRLAPLIALGHHGGASSFRREEPDYERALADLRTTMATAQRSGSAATDSAGDGSGPVKGGLLEALVRWLERRF